MTSYAKPILDPENNMAETFNLNYFNFNTGYVTFADLLNYANLHITNTFYASNVFAVDVDVQGNLNGVAYKFYQYIQYLPNIITELTNITYEKKTNTTYIYENTFFYDTAINNNLVVPNINVNNITNLSLATDSVNTKTLTLNNTPFIDTSVYLYINNLTFPIIKSTPIQSFNVSQINSMAITIKPNYRADVVDTNNVILYSITNTTDNYIYNQTIQYNSNMVKINVYDSLNRQLV
jgi:hypothetical protein